MYQTEVIKCPACYGTGIQRNRKTGLNVLCPVCGGTGKKQNPKRNYSSVGKRTAWEG